MINCSFKLITKLLTERLAKVLPSLIDDTQTAFLKGRLITDNIVCVQEVIHDIKSKNIKGVMFKLDFEKAFDKVNWDFLIETLKARGFGTLFQSWIKTILEGGKLASILMGN